MILQLTEEQLMWVLKGTRFKKPVISMFRDHFVNGVPKVEAAERYDMSPQFAAKKWPRFEELLKEKCEAEGLKVSTIVHGQEDTDAVYKYDVINKKQDTE